MIQADGSFVEYNKSALLIRNMGYVYDKMFERQAVEPVYHTLEASETVEIQQQEVQTIIAPTKEQHMEWSSFLIIFAVMLVALYSIKVLVKRLKELRRDYKDDQFGSTNRSSLLADMDDEWRMQKIDNETPVKRTIGESVIEQQWPTYTTGKSKRTSVSGGRRQADDEYKRS